LSDCDKSCNIRKGLLDCIDKVLEVRECIGAQLAEVSIVTRTWTGERPGDGTFTDVEVPMSPLPQIKDFSHNVRITDASAVKQGDLILIGISQNAYPDENTLRTDTGIKNVEKMIKVGRHYYRTISVKQKLVTWDIQVRKINQDETEKE
jgi:hypothetical protein